MINTALPTPQQLTISIERAKAVLAEMIDGSSDPLAKLYYKFQLDFYDSWNRYLVDLAHRMPPKDFARLLPDFVTWFAAQGLALLDVGSDQRAAQAAFFRACYAALRKQEEHPDPIDLKLTADA